MLGHWFVVIIYQPFFNLLVGIYWLLLQIPSLPYKDMGIAVIIFSIAIRILLLPTSIRASRTEKERFEIEEKFKEIKESHKADPMAERHAMKSAFKEKPAILFSEGFNLAIQVIVALLLWRIFATGLSGADIHLLYGFMPDVPQPYDLKFLGQFDLTHPDKTLNIVQTLTIFILEGLHLLTSPFPVSRKDVVRLQVILPIVAYLIFSMLPAGKKLFVITTLWFSIIFTLVRYSIHLFNKIFNPPEKKEEMPIVVDPAAPPLVRPKP